MNPAIDYGQLPLRDIHLPGPVPWWPPAPGWWLLAALALAGLIVLALRYYRQRKIRTALHALRGVETALAGGAEPVECLQHVSMLLRRFAMTAASDARAPGAIAGLVGEPWLAYLDGAWQRPGFRQGPGRLLLQGPYARAESVTRDEVGEVVRLARDWLLAQPLAPLLARREPGHANLPLGAHRIGRRDQRQ